MINEEYVNKLRDALEYSLTLSLDIVVSIFIITFFCLILMLLRVLINKLGLSSFRVFVWLSSIINLMTMNIINKITKDKELDKINMELYDSLEDKLNGEDKKYKEASDSIIKERIEIPDSPLKTKRIDNDE